MSISITHHMHPSPRQSAPHLAISLQICDSEQMFRQLLTLASQSVSLIVLGLLATVGLGLNFLGLFFEILLLSPLLIIHKFF